MFIKAMENCGTHTTGTTNIYNIYIELVEVRLREQDTCTILLGIGTLKINNKNLEGRRMEKGCSSRSIMPKERHDLKEAIKEAPIR